MNAADEHGSGRFAWLFSRRWWPSGRLARLLTMATVAVLLIVGLVAGWNRWGIVATGGSEYRLQSKSIELTPQPAWIRCDVKEEVMVQGSLANMPVLDHQLTINVARAFELHSWVERVERVQKRPGPQVQVELVYRRPVAMVEVLVDKQPGLMPVDRFGVVLPPGDFSPEQARDYLRVVVDYHQPIGQLGTSWGDERVEGGAAIASLLEEVDWQKCGLYRVVAVSQQDDPTRSEFRYDLLTRSQQRIRWGKAPGSELKGEARATDKVARLVEYVRQHGGLKGNQESQVIDLRVEPTPRISSRKSQPRL